jgi:hypothetical protein
VLYYLAVILVDVAAVKRKPIPASSGELTFAEQVQPQRLEHMPDPETENAPARPKASPGIVASGGVTLKDFFNIAKQESIIYTRPVSFA